MSQETFDFLDRLRDSSIPVAMATLVRTIGTTPRKEGTKMFVGADGRIYGTVTIGGCVDGRVIEVASDVLKDSKPRMLHFQLGNDEAWEIGLTCGGGVDVLVEPLNEEILRTYEAAREEVRAGRTARIATALSGSAIGSRKLVTSDVAKDDEVFVDVLAPPTTLLIIGAGAVAIPLTNIAKTVGLRSVIVDSRPQFASRDRFRDADEIKAGIVSEIVEKMQIDRNTAVILLVHDYKIDIPVLKRVVSTDAAYIGLLGSRKRGAAVLQMLRDENVPEDQIERVRVPIGLDIGGQTAPEIALSIVSEVVALMRGKTGVSLSARVREPALT